MYLSELVVEGIGHVLNLGKLVVICACLCYGMILECMDEVLNVLYII